MLRDRIQEDMKTAMRNHDAKLGTIRMLLAAIKQREIDERITLDDSQILAVIDKMLKQRLDAIEHFTKGKRPDLVAQETAEIEVLQAYLPTQLSEAEIAELLTDAFTATQASSVKDMAKIMAYIKAQAQGRVDMAKISAIVKTRFV